MKKPLKITLITLCSIVALLLAAAQDPDPQDITSNTQWSLNYNDTDLTVEIVLRRNWQDVLRYDLNDNRFLP